MAQEAVSGTTWSQQDIGFENLLLGRHIRMKQNWFQGMLWFGTAKVEEMESSEVNGARTAGLFNKIKRFFRK